MTKSRPTIFILFGATGDLAVKRIFPALNELLSEEIFDSRSKFVAVSRRDWNDASFAAFLKESGGLNFKKEFFDILEYSKVDVDSGEGYDVLKKRVDAIRKESPDAAIAVYVSLAPQMYVKTIQGITAAKIIDRGEGQLFIEKPFGTDESSAIALDTLILSLLDEDQICRIDHYLGKQSIGEMMDVPKKSLENVKSIRIRLAETKGMEGRGASYDGVGAFRDIGQNHLLEMLAVVAAENTDGGWQKARTDVLARLRRPEETCPLFRRGQYEGFTKEKGVQPDSTTETAFEITTSLSSGALSGVPIILEAGKKATKAETFVEVVYKDGTKKIFDITKGGNAHTEVIRAALSGSSREFVGSEEIRALWRYSDYVIASWNKVPLEIYSETKPFLIQ